MRILMMVILLGAFSVDADAQLGKLKKKINLRQLVGKTLYLLKK